MANLNIEPDSFYEKWYPLSNKRIQGTTRSAVNELTELFKMLAGRKVSPDDFWYYRASHSIVTRGEVEMLGLSDPRFARRVLLYDRENEDNSFLGFVNLRRMRRVNDQLPSGFLMHSSKIKSIADSLLQIPGRFLENGWQTLQAPPELFQHYGEDVLTDDELAKFRFMPYIKHLQIVGGGMCAQACCFMAMLTQYREAKRVVSIPEISWLGSYEQDGILRLSGLTSRQCKRFFDDPMIGLSATVQVSSLSHESITADLNEYHWRDLLKTINSYIRAGCPILAGVDMDRMNGRMDGKVALGVSNVYFENGVLDRETARWRRWPRNRRHMVIIMGVNETNGQIVINDPAVAPFLKTHVSSLIKNACYQKSKKTNLVDGDKLEPATIIPVTPNRVKMPLLQFLTGEADSDDMTSQSGLLAIAGSSKFRNLFHDGKNYQPPNPAHCEFDLLPLKRLADHCEHKRQDDHYSAELKQQLESKSAELISETGWQREQWVWRQVGRDFVIIWNAELDPSVSYDTEKDNYFDLLVCVGLRRGNGIQWVKGESQPEYVSSEAEETSAVKTQNQTDHDCHCHEFTIKNAVISTISPKGIDVCSSWLSHQNVSIDLYGFLHPDGPLLLGVDVEDFLPALMSDPIYTIKRLAIRAIKFPLQFFLNFVGIDFNRKRFYNPLGLYRKKYQFERFILPTTNVCRWLALKENDDDCIDKIAQQINEKTKASGGCCAITTFFPGLSGKKGDESREAAVKSLRCVLKIAKAYNSLVGEHKIKVVQTVGGWLTCDLKVFLEEDTQPEETGSWKKLLGLKRLARHEQIHTWIRKLGIEIGDLYVQAKVMDSTEAKNNIISSLKDAILPDGNVSLAVALDPGPLFAISKWSDLTDMAWRLARDPDLARHVGFNCDIAHWHIAGITPAHIVNELHRRSNANTGNSQSATVATRLIHTHVSDSGKGFLGYLPSGSQNSPEHFVEWLSAVKMAYSHASDQSPKPTGVASVELELPASKSIIDKAMASNRIFCAPPSHN